jgi:hypothetical protein
MPFMGIREKLNDGPIGLIVTIVFVILAAGVAIYLIKPKSLPNPHITFYSDDDGQSYFTDGVYNFPPFDHNGREADLALVYADSNGHRFVGYMMRYTPDAAARLRAEYAQDVANNKPDLIMNLLADPSIALAGMQIKLPGSSHKWVPYSQMLTPDVRAPDGSTDITPVQNP